MLGATAAVHTATVVTAVTIAALQVTIAATVAALSTAATAIAVRKLLKEVSVSALLRQKPKATVPVTPAAVVLTAHTAKI